MDRVQLRLFCDQTLDREINRFLEEREEDDDIEYITECKVPDGYTIYKMLKSNGAAIIMKNNKKYFLAEDTIIEFHKTEEKLFDKIFDNPESKIFKYDEYPTYIFKVGDKYYIKYDYNEDVCEVPIIYK